MALPSKDISTIRPLLPLLLVPHSQLSQGVLQWALNGAWLPLLSHSVFSRRGSQKGLLEHKSDRDPPLLKAFFSIGIQLGKQKPLQIFQREGMCIIESQSQRSVRAGSHYHPQAGGTRGEKENLQSEPLLLELTCRGQHFQLLWPLMQLPRGEGCQNPRPSQIKTLPSLPRPPPRRLPGLPVPPGGGVGGGVGGMGGEQNPTGRQKARESGKCSLFSSLLPQR